MGNLGGDVSPHAARDAAGLVESMQRLKDRSGLTYRALEERAARNGDVLARSTLSDILRRTSLPHPDVLAAFVRACGDEQRVGVWLDARDRIAAGLAAVPSVAPGSGPSTAAEQSGAEEAAAGPRRRSRGRALTLVASLMVPPLALGAWGLLPDGSEAPAASQAPAEGWVTIRPARTPDLCLTDGRDREGAYASAVAAQLPCARATVPRTYLEPAGDGLYRIQWHHPEEGKGCLTVMSTGPVKGMLEPWDDCSEATLFRVAAAADDGGGFRLRPVGSSRCIGIAEDDTTVGAEAVEERCTDAADQRFLIRTG
ncbi:RICIN domain-containing protein [Streptomyces rubrogriseus]|uniref:RICIN domain-containing protein n=1 Tax=Streptomyces rubrogriseus TaxID=194673 RepID=UPI0038241080